MWSLLIVVLAQMLWTLLLFGPATPMINAAVLHPSGGFQPSLGLGLDYGRLDGPAPALTADYDTGKEACALVLSRSSLYDHTQSIFFGAGWVNSLFLSLNCTLYFFIRSGYGENCITYVAVDHALAQALQYLRIETPEEEWMPEQLATVGEVFLETARILTRRYSILKFVLILHLIRVGSNDSLLQIKGMVWLRTRSKINFRFWIPTRRICSNIVPTSCRHSTAHLASTEDLTVCATTCKTLHGEPVSLLSLGYYIWLFSTSNILIANGGYLTDYCHQHTTMAYRSHVLVMAACLCPEHVQWLLLSTSRKPSTITLLPL